MWKASRHLYYIFVFLRLVIILTSTSYIHPDEFFQNIEIAIDDVFNPSKQSHLARAWEWNPTKPHQIFAVGNGPIRSIVPVWLTSHVALNLLKFLNRWNLIKLSTRSLVIAPRLALFPLSCLVDYCAFRLTKSQSIRLLLASSPFSLLFLCRTFSNSLESILFTLILTLSLSIHPHRLSKSSVALLTFLNVLTLWVRVTYLAFALPVVLWFGYTRLIRSPSLLTTAVLSALFSVVALTLVDSFYFHRWPCITPLEFLIYNLDRRNLALHGTHPYWLHLLINGPIAFGPALWLAGWYGIRIKMSSTILVKLSALSLCSGVLVLSLQPHQEPRFLLPLGLPLAVLGSQVLRKNTWPFRNGFWTVHLIHSIVIVALFGYLHQAGLETALQALPPEARTLISYKTFDVPSTLITTAQLDNVENLRGSSKKHLMARLCDLKIDEACLLSPRWAIDLDDENWLVLAWSSSIPHLDLDRLDEIWNAGFQRSGMALWRINQNITNSAYCLQKQLV
ncbi:hypothetical protein O181_006360 [Austropuccinia psidii MF-1]|uniref:Mannosyltransferase n=1 Tax=Austropuccinia psidii MF-1 TaxID=1389203 RepID=A0A9Q3GGS2_9BASI|nr:hypothetical protein [Austropuccinia psidii MF-1]